MRRALALVAASFAFVLLVPTMVLFPSLAGANTYTWANVGSNWGTAANWGGTLPGGSDVGQFTLAGYTAQPNLGTPNTIGGVWNTGNGPVTVTGGAADDQRHNDQRQCQHGH